MRYTQDQENYFKLIILVHDLGANVNRQLFQKFLRSIPTTLEQFINDHQHEIYHFFCKIRCCQCNANPLSLTYPKVINRKQMLIIFEHSSTNRFDNHQHQKTGTLCCLKANKNVGLKDLDFTLIRFFLVNFCYQVFWDCHLHDKKPFAVFLEENVHKVYHLSVDKICCCMCNNDRDIPDKCINFNETHFRKLFEKGSSPCQHTFCICQYSIQSNLTLSSLIQQDKNSTSILTMHFCSCRKCLDNIYEQRNTIAHPLGSSINNHNDATFLAIWNETATDILEIAKALNIYNQYEEQIQRLREEESTNKDSLITVLLDLLKTSEHVTLDVVQKIEDKTDSIENKIGAVFEVVTNIQSATCNNRNSIDCCPQNIGKILQDIAIAVCKDSTSESNPDKWREMEVSFNVEIRNTGMSNQLAQGGGDNNSDIDEQPDDLTCGKCKMNFTKLNEFCKHKETHSKKQMKPAEDNSSIKIIYKIKMSGACGRWKTKALEMNQSDPDCFDTDTIGVCHIEKGCLVVWAESSQSDLDNADTLKENCIQFTQNMFQKCSMDFTETANINVTVKFSTIYEDSSATKDDDSDSLKCGTCRQEFFTINSFITHRKECARNRKMIKRHQEDISELPQSSEEPPETISRRESDSTNQSISSQLPKSSKKPPETISGTESDSTNQSMSSQIVMSKQAEDAKPTTFGQMQYTPTVEDDIVPIEIKLMSNKKSIPLYLKLLESGSEKKRDIRLVIVGKKGTGKTSLCKRLFEEEVSKGEVKSTNGIEIHRIKCNANYDDGIWNKLNANNQGTERNARLLKPYEETLVGQGKGTNKASVTMSVEAKDSKTVMKASATSLGESEETASLQHEKPKPHLIANCDIKSHVASEPHVEPSDATKVIVKSSITTEPLVIPFDTTFYHKHQPNLSLEQAYVEVENMLKSEVNIHDKEEYATLLLWDFAGDEEFYHTHQTFMSPNAIYLVVAKLNEAYDKDAQDLFRLWMDSIHCYGRIEEEKNKYDDLDPSVVVVGTWKDACTSESADAYMIEDACREHLLAYTRNMADDERGHIKAEVFISNTEDDNIVFQKIRQDILKLAKTNRTWNKEYPLKFIQMEKRIQEKKKELPIVAFHELKLISTETPMPLNDEELILYLKFHHEIRDLVYFEDLPDYIILDTQWLSDAFKCIVTAKKFRSISIKNQKRWEEFHSTGKLYMEILEDIFKEQNILYKHKDHILDVMEKFDIIIRPIKPEEYFAIEQTCYYVPCMIKSEPECDIYKILNVTKNTCKKSTWLCFKFRFLPPHLMNHLIASLCREYEVAEVSVIEHEDRRNTTQRVIALFRGTAVFELKKTTKLQKLLITTCPNFILVQILEFGKRLIIERGMYKHIAHFVTEEIKKIISTRFKMTNVNFEKKWDCGLTKPESVIGSHDFSAEEITEYYCEKCTSTHEFTDEWSDLQINTLCLSKTSQETTEANSKTETISENQTISTKLSKTSQETTEANSKTETISENQTISTKVSLSFKGGLRAFSNVNEDSTGPSTCHSLKRFTKEEINYAKMGMILLNILIDVLYDLLKQDKTIHRLRSDCDITYLYKEHKRINKHEPSIGWGGTWLDIQSTNITIGDDIERIRNTRNELQHCKTFMLDDKRFNDLYSIIEELLKRFDIHNKPTRLYTDQLNEIVAKSISAEEVKAVENEISEMIIEVEIEHLVNVTPQ